MLIHISIHAPAKGATYNHLRRYLVAAFQSTLPRRERPSYSGSKSITFYFNPRSREGSDNNRKTITRWQNIFQSTLPRRERPHFTHLFLPPYTISIHAPAKGATLYQHRFSLFHIFQSTLPRRERQKTRCYNTIYTGHFNPRSREGSDPVRRCCRPSACQISIHAPAKGATAKITKTIPDDFHKINNCNNSFA